MSTTDHDGGRPIRVMLVMRSVIIRDAISGWFAHRDGLALAGAYDTTDEAVSAVIKEAPDVILSGFRLPDIDPARLAITMREQLHLSVPVLVFTGRPEPEVVHAALRAPVAGVIPFGVSPEAFVVAIRAAHLGFVVLSSDARAALTAGIGLESPTVGDHVRSMLTSREREVFDLMLTGRANKEIATSLGIGIRTAEVHVSHVVAKLHARSRAEAIVMALHSRNGHAV